MEQNVKKKLKNFIENKTGGCRILVVGDLMLDKYYYGEVTRISPEAPVPITHVIVRLRLPALSVMIIMVKV